MVAMALPEPQPQPDDVVSRVRANWERAMPNVDTSVIEVLGRINRISALATQQLERVLAPSGVSRSEFDVLSALARALGPLRASDVTAQTMLSGAATTKLTARLEQIGLLERERSERDGRVVMLKLTKAGRDLVKTEFPRMVERDALLIAGLDADERATLAELLRKLSIEVDAAATRLD
jgi:DNA-binding MarR family transcriptional regulator